MRASLFNAVLVLVAVAYIGSTDALDQSRSLHGLLTEFIHRYLSDAHFVFLDVAPKFENLDWSNDTDSSAALESVPCNVLCGVCWKWEKKDVYSQCENHCEERCQWKYNAEPENSRQTRGLIDICLGVPDGLSISFGGITDLLSKIPLIGSLIGK